MSQQETVPDYDDADLDEDDVVELPPPDIKGARFGTVQELWRCWRYNRKRRKLATKGYVEWYLVNGSWPTAKFVRPKSKGGGIPEIKHDGKRYIFPPEAGMATARQGMWTFVHNRNKAEPRNLRDPDEMALDADALEEYIQMRPSTSPPSWLSKFNMDSKDLIRYALFGTIAFAVLQQLLGGGF